VIGSRVCQAARSAGREVVVIHLTGSRGFVAAAPDYCPRET
jgi:hypothetical protein